MANGSAAFIFIVIIALSSGNEAGTNTSCSEHSSLLQMPSEAKRSLGTTAPWSLQSGHLSCINPLDSIMKTLTCIEQKNATCAGSGYTPEFKKFHNDVDTHASVTAATWEGAFTFTSFNLTYSHTAEISPTEGNRTYSAMIRYVEAVTTVDLTTLGCPARLAPPVETILQHEQALITVDNECKMILWDQYGDDAEQAAVGAAIRKMVPCFPFIGPINGTDSVKILEGIR
eukprot:TRINITY_DN77709_c0_g1_i1.p1 TRINITY_DN77709_c0_g1~~TRINITY_DN77709_c0_g1_i1.p1  ORF type:complete len:229 (-),score=28.90 TRINITY_DN77709_c0_g1_i1:98-784(-)